MPIRGHTPVLKSSGAAHAAWLEQFDYLPEEEVGLREIALVDGLILTGLYYHAYRTWSVVCMTHGSRQYHATLAMAHAYLRDPATWCVECQEGKT